MTSLHLFLLILLMRVAHFSYIVTSIIVYGTFNLCCKGKVQYSPLVHDNTLRNFEV